MRPESYPIRLPRQPGQKEVRFAHLLSGDVHVEAPAEVVPRPSQREALEQKVDMLAAQIEELRQQFEQFKKQFE